MALSSAAQVEFARLDPDAHAVLELTLPGGVKRYVNEGAPVHSDSLGYFEGKVLNWGGGITLSMGDSFQPFELTVEIQDYDRSLDAILFGSSAKDVYNATFAIRIASKGIPQAEWPVRAGGRIADFQGAGQFVWRFYLRSHDYAFRARSLPIEAIGPYDFPNIGDVKLYGTPIPLVFGLFDSRDGSGAGQGPIGGLPGYYVETTGGAQRVLLCYGDAFHVERIYFDNTVQSSANWIRETLTMPGFNTAGSQPPYIGRRMTFAKFTASGPSATTKITWDGYGLALGGLGPSGGSWPLENPVDIMRCVLSVLGLPDEPWRNGPYGIGTDHALLDTASWNAARDWFANRRPPYRSALFLGEYVDVMTLVNDFAADHGIRLAPTLAGKLALRPRDPNKMVVYYDTSTTWLRAHEADTNPIVPERDRDPITELAAGSFQVPAQNHTRTEILVGDYSRARTSERPRLDGASPTGARRRFAAGSARFLRDLLDSPKGVYFVDALMDTTLGGDLFDGVAIGTWNDIKAGSPKYDLTQGTANQKPLLSIGAVGARPSLVFDGSNDNMTGTTLSNLIGVSGYHVVIALKATVDGGGNNDANAILNPAWFCDSSGKFGLYQRLDAGQNYLQFAIDDGALKVAKVPISLNTWYVISLFKLGGTSGTAYIARDILGPYVSVGGGFVACGDITSLAGTFQIGKNPGGGAFAAGEIAALIVQNDPDPAAQGSLAGVSGGGGLYYAHRAVTDLLGLPALGSYE